MLRMCVRTEMALAIMALTLLSTPATRWSQGTTPPWAYSGVRRWSCSGIAWAANQARQPAGKARMVEKWIAMLKGPDPQGRVRAATALGRSGDPRAVQPLIAAMLKDGHQTELGFAAEQALEWIGRPAVGPLLELLKQQSSYYVRQQCVDILGTIGDVRAVEPLISLLKDPAAPRHLVATALGSIGDRRAVSPLISLLQGSDWYLKEHAALALGNIGDRAAVPSLITLLSDPKSGARSAAADALGRIGDPHAADPLAELVERADSVCMHAAYALAALRAPGTIDRMLPLLVHDNPVVRKSAARAIAGSKEARVKEALLQALARQDLAVVEGGYEFFIRRGGPESEAILLRALEEGGSSDMAEAMLTCGNDRLSTAAYDWAKAHHYRIFYPPSGSRGPRWGSGN